MAPGRFGSNFKNVIFKLILQIDIMSVSFEMVLRWMTQDISDD